MTTVLMWVDAFSEKYLSKEYTPYMYELASKGVASNLRPMFAFRGVETTIFTGLWPEEHGDWTEFKLAKNPTAYPQIYRLLLRLADMTGHDKLRKIARIGVQMLANHASTRLTPNVIPVELMNYFELTQSDAVFKYHARERITLFDLIIRNKMTFHCLYPPYLSGDRGLISSVSKVVHSRKEVDLLFLKMNMLDRVGHVYGPEPSKFAVSLREVDQIVDNIITRIEKVSGECNILIFSDHGMSLVYNYIDMFSDLERLDLNIPDDYMLFLDSTMARFWFNTNKARLKVVDYLNSLEYGHILSTEELRRLHVPIDRSYGEVVFAVDEGTAIYPDFWSGDRKPTGMHGYAYTKTREGHAALISNTTMSEYYSVRGRAEYVEILPWVLNALGLQKLQPSKI